MGWELKRVLSADRWYARDRTGQRDALIAEEGRQVARIVGMARQELPKILVKSLSDALENSPKWLRWASPAQARQLLNDVKALGQGEIAETWCTAFERPQATHPGHGEFLGYADSWTDYFPDRAEIEKPLREILEHHGYQGELRVHWDNRRLDTLVDQYHERSQDYAHARYALEAQSLESTTSVLEAKEELGPEASVA